MKTKFLIFAIELILVALFVLSLHELTKSSSGLSANNSLGKTIQPATANLLQTNIGSALGSGVTAAANAIAASLVSGPNTTNTPIVNGRISASALKQISALETEKEKRTPVQQKIDTQLLYADKMGRGIPIAEGVPTQRVDLDKDDQGRVLLDIKADVTGILLQYIKMHGGNVIGSYPQYHAIVAGVPLAEIQNLAAQKEVIFIKPVVQAMQDSVDSEGDYTHQANTARANFGVDGTGVKVGVISDSVDYLSGSQIDGVVTVLPGQDGMPDTGEGTAMLEIVNDLAPGARLYFATGANNEYQMAANIRSLRYTYGCDIIVDDELYYDESPFQDGVVAQAVNDVTANGALYFSSASNSGNKDGGTSGTWEGDFSDSGQTTVSGDVNSFGSQNYDAVTGNGPGGKDLHIDLFWADPLGASTNDYDLYILDQTGSNVIASSTNPQNGFHDPYEGGITASNGERIVVVKFSGASRFLHLDTGRGELAINTPGSTRGHNCTTNALGVAATDARKSYPNAFAGGSVNPVETYSSDGPRRIFFQTDGTPITPGNFSASGGTLRQKPDITAADGVTTGVSGFVPFTGTSAAAPHAAAIAALIKSYNQNLTSSQIRAILTNATLDIMSAGVDRDSGEGIVMALRALQQTPLSTPIQAPASLAGIAVGGIIASGTYPWFDSGGYWLLIPANSGNTAQLITCATEPFVGISSDSVTYSYSASSSTGNIQLQLGSYSIVGKFGFSVINFGSYAITNVSVAPILADSTGEFEIFPSPTLLSVAGKTFRCFIQYGISPYYSSGTFDFKTGTSGSSYTNFIAGTTNIDSWGTYSYSQVNSSVGKLQLNDSLMGAQTIYVAFQSGIEGEFMGIQISSSSFQIGHFVLVDTTPPNLSIQLPAAGARIISPMITAQGTAADNTSLAGVAYQLNINGWAVAAGSANWTAANLQLIPGTNILAAYAEDASGNRSPTNTVRFQYVVTNLLQVQVTGLGTISPNYSNAWLEIGRNYSMTAAAAIGFVFTNWTGGVVTNSAMVTFMMASNLALSANFVDVTKPALSITNLAAGQRVSNAVFTVQGNASDNWRIGNVAYHLNGGAWSNAVTANHWTNWSGLVNLLPGTNSIQAYALDSSGNSSVTNSLNFQFVVTNLLGVRATGLGTINPNYSNSWLEVGRNYTITATPADGFIVTNWTISTNWIGGRVTNSAAVVFMMVSNLTLQLNFADITKPSLTVSSPTANQHMTNALANLAGISSDNWKVAGVWYQLNTNAWSLVSTSNGYTNWNRTVTLVAGTNTLKVYAQDLGGNYSATNSFGVVSSNTFMLQFTSTVGQPPSGSGLNFVLQISPGLSGHIQASTNLMDWLTLTNFGGTNATINFRDATAPNYPHRYYRAVVP